MKVILFNLLSPASKFSFAKQKPSYAKALEGEAFKELVYYGFDY